jgi:23S rRNA (uracil1939-C5)-methyltransferase
MDEHANKPSAESPVVTVEKLVYGGAGLARHEGRAVLIPLTLPGDRVAITVDRQKTGLWEAHATEWLERSPAWQEAPCPVFGQCGGCHYQHMPYADQLPAKVEILREALRRIGKVEAPAEIGVLAGEPWQYRNRIQFHIDRARLGFQQMRSNRLVAIEDCPISAPKLSEAVSAIRKLLHDPHWPRFLKSLELFTNGETVLVNVRETEGDRGLAKGFFSWLSRYVPGAQDGHLDYDAAGYRFRVSHGAFFQVNRFLVDALVDAALGDATGGSALDLYAGVGLFSLPLTRRFASVTAVESDGAAVRDLTVNAETHQAKVQVHRMQAEQFLEQFNGAPDFIVADPPRSGLGKTVVKHLLRIQSPRVTLVSCDPSTLARDLSALMAGGYSIGSMQLIDLFPQTYHIETIVHLTR